MRLKIIQIEDKYKHKEYCLLCQYGVDHTPMEHAAMLNFTYTYDFVSSLKIGSLIPTPFGVREVRNIYMREKYTSSQNSVLVEHAANGLRYQEEFLILYKFLDIGVPYLLDADSLFKFVPKPSGDEHDTYSSHIFARLINSILEEYNIQDSIITDVEADLEEEVKKWEITEAFSEWFGR